MKAIFYLITILLLQLTKTDCLYIPSDFKYYGSGNYQMYMTQESTYHDPLFNKNYKLQLLNQVLGCSNIKNFNIEQKDGTYNIFLCQNLANGICDLEINGFKYLGWILVDYSVQHSLTCLNNTNIFASVGATSPDNLNNADHDSMYTHQTTDTFNVGGEFSGKLESDPADAVGGKVKFGYSKNNQDSTTYKNYIYQWNFWKDVFNDNEEKTNMIYHQQLPWSLNYSGDSLSAHRYQNWSSQAYSDNKFAKLPDLSVSMSSQRIFVPFTISSNTSLECKTDQWQMTTIVSPTLAFLVGDKRIYLKRNNLTFKQVISLKDFVGNK